MNAKACYIVGKSPLIRILIVNCLEGEFQWPVMTVLNYLKGYPWRKNYSKYSTFRTATNTGLIRDWDSFQQDLLEIWLDGTVHDKFAIFAYGAEWSWTF